MKSFYWITVRHIREESIPVQADNPLEAIEIIKQRPADKRLSPSAKPKWEFEAFKAD